MGDVFAENGNLSNAQDAYRAAGCKFPKEKALLIAQLELEKGNMFGAYKVYRIAEDKAMIAFTRQFVSEDLR